MSTAGGIVVTALIHGTVLAYDDQTLDELWRINVGSGFNAPPTTNRRDGELLSNRSRIASPGAVTRAGSAANKKLRYFLCLV
jgi:hypothetical protein